MKIDKQIKQELEAYLKKRLREESGKVKIIAPYELGAEEMNLIYADFPYLKNDNVEVLVSPDQLAGVTIQFGTKMIDLSLKSALIRLEKRLHDAH